MTTATANYYLIESTGDNRQVWGPYTSLEQAKREAGVRHAVVSGSGLRNGETMTRGAMISKLAAGQFWTVDGSELS
ncbi:hypothetical protein [Gemmata sp.]|uniref:hypothetical protein n=1 Tax=Gemmata sp. TaxID=1914242 RepID=UPI003F712BE5